MKLKYHRLKPGGVAFFGPVVFSCEIEVPPAKAGGVAFFEPVVFSYEIEIPPAKARRCRISWTGGV